MKPRTIATDHGIFTLDDTGFYIPFEEPEPKVSGLWLWALAGICMLGIAAIGWGLLA
jgi:hypothetical protein